MSRTPEFIDLARAYVAALCRVYNEIGHHSYREPHLKDLRADFTRAIDMVLKPEATTIEQAPHRAKLLHGDKIHGNCIAGHADHLYVGCELCGEVKNNETYTRGREDELKRVLDFILTLGPVSTTMLNAEVLHERLIQMEHRK